MNTVQKLTGSLLPNDIFVLLLLFIWAFGDKIICFGLLSFFGFTVAWLRSVTFFDLLWDSSHVII